MLYAADRRGIHPPGNNYDVDAGTDEDDEVADGGRMCYHDDVTSWSRDPATANVYAVAGDKRHAAVEVQHASPAANHGGAMDKHKSIYSSVPASEVQSPSYMDYVDHNDGEMEMSLSEGEEDVMVARRGTTVGRYGYSSRVSTQQRPRDHNAVQPPQVVLV